MISAPYFSATLGMPGSDFSCPQVAELQERATSQNQEQNILQRSLQDRATEVEVERLGAKVSARGSPSVTG